jgi:hypothetical protein
MDLDRLRTLLLEYFKPKAAVRSGRCKIVEAPVG